MNKDLVFYVAASLVAIGVGAFVFWCPSTSVRRRRVPVIGLKNLGLTCFLNSVLQALASCPIFIEWLENSGYQDCISLSLSKLLRVLSEEAETSGNGEEEALSPISLINVLRQRGWGLPPGEQDAHEWFHHLIMTMDEEAQKELRVSSSGCLTDALLPAAVTPHNVIAFSRSFPLALGNKRTKGGRVPDQTHSSSWTAETDVVPSSSNGSPALPLDGGTNKCAKGDLRNSGSPNGLRIRKPSPFTGRLTSQTLCTECGFKSVLRFDKFDSLSLHLPPPEPGLLLLKQLNSQGHHTLTQLLDRYVATEVVDGVACEGCNRQQPPEGPRKKSKAIRCVGIGMLPRCLCIHINWLSFNNNGESYKRQDFVDFPEFLIMDPYTHSNTSKELLFKKEKSSDPGKESPQNSKESEPSDPRPSQSSQSAESSDVKLNEAKHIYRVKAVIVHRGGSAHVGGHFVTYRRGPLASQRRHRSIESHGERSRWYFTSDTDVRDATLSEALCSPPFMLFYEKCAPDDDDIRPAIPFSSQLSSSSSIINTLTTNKQ